MALWKRLDLLTAQERAARSGGTDDDDGPNKQLAGHRMAERMGARAASTLQHDAGAGYDPKSYGPRR
jgi:hypothetical protein